MVSLPPHVARVDPTSAEGNGQEHGRAAAPPAAPAPVASSRDHATLSRSARHLARDAPSDPGLSVDLAARLADDVAERLVADPDGARGAHLGGLMHRAARRST